MAGAMDRSWNLLTFIAQTVEEGGRRTTGHRPLQCKSVKDAKQLRHPEPHGYRDSARR